MAQLTAEQFVDATVNKDVDAHWCGISRPTFVTHARCSWTDFLFSLDFYQTKRRQEFSVTLKDKVWKVKAMRGNEKDPSFPS